MHERTREQLRATHSPLPGSGIFDDSGSAPGLVTVTHGIYRNDLPVGEMSIAQVRSRFRDRFDIHPAATALLDGNPADEQTILRAGQRLTFVRPSGEKGR